MTVRSEVAGYITQADNVSIITGAGASKAAGIPMAGQMVEMVCKEFGHCLGSLSEEDRTDYGKVMRKLSRKDRESFIQPLLDNSGINWGQIALALMLQNNHVARVLTFNFDLVLERAAALLGLQLPIYDFGAAPAGATDIQRVSSQAIIHLHGQSNGLVLLNTEQETKEHGEKLRPILADTVQRHVTIVTGYSGLNDAALDVIVEEYAHSPNHLLWLGYSKSPPTHLKPLLEREHVRYFGGCDFDLTMIAVAKELGIWPPQLINNPMLHLLEELKPVKNYPVQEKAEVDVLDETRKRLTEHAEAWDGNSTPNDAAFAGLVGGSEKPSDQRPQQETTTPALSEAAKNAASWVLIEEGDALVDQARTLSGAAAQGKFDAASEKYSEAVRIKLDKHVAFNNWGFSLWDQAKTHTGAAAQAKFDAANEKFSEALRIKPDLHETFYNWGSALSDQARTLSGAAAQAKFDAANVKFSEAVRIKPDMHEAFYNWGTALLEQAKTLSGMAAQAKFDAASEKYSEAVRIKPDKHEAFSNWGSALSEQAKTLSGKDKKATLEKAKEVVLKGQEITGKVSYNMACYFALSDDPDAAMQALSASLADGTIPDRAHLQGDSDMDSLRDLPEFQEFQDRLPE